MFVSPGFQLPVVDHRLVDEDRGVGGPGVANERFLGPELLRIGRGHPVIEDLGSEVIQGPRPVARVPLEGIGHPVVEGHRGIAPGHGYDYRVPTQYLDVDPSRVGYGLGVGDVDRPELVDHHALQ
jgi:hypothetical protein